MYICKSAVVPCLGSAAVVLIALLYPIPDGQSIALVAISRALFVEAGIIVTWVIVAIFWALHNGETKPDH